MRSYYDTKWRDADGLVSSGMPSMDGDPHRFYHNEVAPGSETFGAEGELLAGALLYTRGERTSDAILGTPSLLRRA